MQLTKSNKKSITAWAMYDWASSVYTLLIISAIFPVYYLELTTHGKSDTVLFFGSKFINTALYSYSIAVAFFVLAVLSPVLYKIAQCSVKRVFFFKLFCYIGAFACACLYFFTGTNIELAILCSSIACFGYAGSLIFYFSFLPHLAAVHEQESATIKGFALGYIGSTLLLIIAIIMILNPGFFFIPADTIAVRITFLLVGLWWIGFAQLTFRGLPKAQTKEIINHKIIAQSYLHLLKTFNELSTLPKAKRFFWAFVLYIMSIQTVMYAATLFVIKEIHMKDVELIPTIFIIQVVAVLGAFIASWLSAKISDIRTLSLALILWIGVDSSAYFVNTPIQFMVVAFVLGLGLGGVFALSRSTFIKYLPADNNADFLNIYDIAERFCIAVGMFLFGYLEVLTQNMRVAVLVFTSFLVIGLILLLSIPKISFLENQLEKEVR
ncbi:MFS transporter [Solitalea sp. MAHUQ-68]|uniref:MFS transporter n=1 Tax=Solitalea agri TaxID=2953739 RepID=A0A9X2FCV6_9SPHI|nr:MFS transporter [Solitalea agri]MCO4294523.1 MFS transporter [Solitalea agri]